jgi:hypothetical protein
MILLLIDCLFPLWHITALVISAPFLFIAFGTASVGAWTIGMYACVHYSQHIIIFGVAVFGRHYGQEDTSNTQSVRSINSVI